MCAITGWEGMRNGIKYSTLVVELEVGRGYVGGMLEF